MGLLSWKVWSRLSKSQREEFVYRFGEKELFSDLWDYVGNYVCVSAYVLLVWIILVSGFLTTDMKLASTLIFGLFFKLWLIIGVVGCGVYLLGVFVSFIKIRRWLVERRIIKKDAWRFEVD